MNKEVKYVVLNLWFCQGPLITFRLLYFNLVRQIFSLCVTNKLQLNKTSNNHLQMLWSAGDMDGMINKNLNIYSSMLSWVPANLMHGVTLGWTSIPSRGE